MCHIILTCCSFWTVWPYFYSVVAVPRSAVPFTLKSAEFSVSALQPSQQCYYNFWVSMCIPLVFFTVYLFAAKPEGSRKFFHLNCTSQTDRRELISAVEEHCLLTDLRWIIEKPPLLRTRVRVEVLPLIIGCYGSTLDHHPLSDTLLCFTACVCKMILLLLSREDFTA